MVQANPYPLRVDRTLMKKFKVVAEDHGRSVNKEIEMLIKESVLSYERENGPILIPDEEEQE